MEDASGCRGTPSASSSLRSLYTLGRPTAALCVFHIHRASGGGASISHEGGRGWPCRASCPRLIASTSAARSRPPRSPPATPSTGESASAVAAAASREMEICKKWDNSKIPSGPALLEVGFVSQLPFLVQYSSIFFGRNVFDVSSMSLRRRRGRLETIPQKVIPAPTPVPLH